LAEQSLTARFTPQLDTLEQQSRDNKKRADAHKHQILALLAQGPVNSSTGSVCELGAAAD
jgi:hypothetical protein